MLLPTPALMWLALVVAPSRLHRQRPGPAALLDRPSRRWPLVLPVVAPSRLHRQRPGPAAWLDRPPRRRPLVPLVVMPALLLAVGFRLSMRRKLPRFSLPSLLLAPNLLPNRHCLIMQMDLPKRWDFSLH